MTTLRFSLVDIDYSLADPDQLTRLIAAARSAERTIERLKIHVGVAAERLAADEWCRGAHGLFLGDGRFVRGSTARREARRCHTVTELELVGAAVQRGEIGAEHVDLFGRAAAELASDQRPQLNDSDLVASAASEPIDVFARRIRRVVELIKGDHGADDVEARRRASKWRSWFNERTGMGHVHGEFDPERFEAICNSVDGQLSRLANQGGAKKNPNLAATAAHELITGYGGGQGRSPHVGVVVDWDTFVGGGRRDSIRESTNGRSLASQTISRLACNAVIQRIVLDEQGVPINVGRRHRTATDAQWIAVRATYRGCAWAGCDRPLAWCQLHHVHEWEHGGPTDLCNLVPLCGEHHHAVHEGGWSLRLWSNRRLDIHRPDGGRHATTKPDRHRRQTATAPDPAPRRRVTARTQRRKVPTKAEQRAGP